MDFVPGAVLLPAVKLVVDGLPRREVWWEIIPLATSAGDVEDGVEHISYIMDTGWFGDTRRKQRN